ncbi:DUF1353 domain-containing protein [Spirosoma sp.]|uniref:DUF1353 domain-containing protein n=1 Tax=Spirosoma sp. TaxID=1899569 RepID=UPI002638855B|nr:DUF1353 domain-containing protein [Spirosoma sp.]MCX6217620.1 DUF1353 domain-containing protein [Spirosoma sp.]
MNVAREYTYAKTATEVRNLPLVSDSTLEKADQMRLGAAIRVELNDGRWVTVPEGFVTDLFSVPPWLHTLFKPYDNRLNLASIVHDYLYEYWEVFEKDQRCYIGLEWEPVYYAGGEERRYADRAMLDIMLRFRQHNKTLHVFYYAVRLGGRSNWNYFRHRNQHEKVI